MEHAVSKDTLKAKLEAPSRLRELNPASTLAKIGFKADQVLCDIGTGTGVFAMPAAEESARMVYALDVSSEAVQVVDRKAREAGLHNVQAILIAADGSYDVPDGEVDVALLCCVLHEIDESVRPRMLGEVFRILADDGVFAVIEFKKEATGFGPPRHIRISKEELQEFVATGGFAVCDDIDLSQNLYCMVFRKVTQ